MTPVAAGSETVLDLPGWTVRIEAPERVAQSLTALLSRLDLASDPLPSLRLTIPEGGRWMACRLKGRESWQVSLPPDQPLAEILGQCVAAATMVLRRHVFAHAGVVAMGDQATIIVGKSGSGKTATAIRLLARGALYLSDEVALIDAQSGTVAPLLIPMAIKPWTEQAAGGLPDGDDVVTDGRVRYRMPSRMCARPVPIRNIVLLTPARRPQGLSPMSRGEMLLALGAHETSLVHRDRLAEAFGGFARIVRRARCYAGQGAGSNGLADLLAAQSLSP